MKKTLSPFAYTSAREFVLAYRRQDGNTYETDAHYFRGGSPRLAAVETYVAELVGVEKGHLALTTSGMSAVTNIFEVASLTANDIVVHGITEYAQIYHYINVDLRERGIIPVEADFGNIDAIDQTLKSTALQYGKNAIKVIFLETVGNGPEMSVLDVEKFLALPIVKEIDPLIILDNTLPTNSVVPLAKLIKKSPLRIVGLESATKFYLLNQDLGGLYFTYHDSLLQKLLTKRKRTGATPGPSLIAKFEKLLPESTQQFTARNRKIMENTKFLAEACRRAYGREIFFTVSHPNLAHHKNYDYTQKGFSGGIAPVFFIATTKNSFCTAEELFYLLEEKGVFEHMTLTESFGFDKTVTFYGPRYGGYIRVAAGAESTKEINKIGDSLRLALSEIFSSSHRSLKEERPHASNSI